MMYREHLKSRIDEFLWSFNLGLGFNTIDIWALLLFLVSSPIIILNSIKEFFENMELGVIPLSLLGLFFAGIIMYLSLILGEPNQKKWAEIFAHYTNRISVLIRDSNGNVIGEIDNPKLVDKRKSALYPNDLPEFYLDMLIHREERLLVFDNNSTGIKGLFYNPRSFNGIDAIGMPIAIIKSSIKSLYSNQQPRGGSSLSQQLVKNYYGMYSMNIINRKYKELSEAKIFYHNLKANNGAEFKRFVSISTPAVIAQGTQYGIRTASMIIFGKKLIDLEKYEQALLSRMHLTNFKFNNNYRCNRIKIGTLVDLNTYFRDKKDSDSSDIEEIKQEVKDWECPKEPNIPFNFYNDFSSLDYKGKIAYGALDTRLQILASSSASLVKKELSDYRKLYPNRLLVESKLTIDSAKNIKFKESVTSALSKVENKIKSKLMVDLDGSKQDKDEREANIWISVTNEKGEVIRIYKKGNTSYNRRIGSISKVFASIALGNRGDTPNTLYWNKPYKGLHNSNGSQGGELNSKNTYSAKVAFGASKNLPILSALNEYISIYNGTFKAVKRAISNNLLERISKAFFLLKDNKVSSIKYEMSFGLSNANPLSVQKAIHKLAHILYYRGKYNEAHIIKSLNYKTIADKKISGLLKKDSSIIETKISKETQKIFDMNTRRYIKGVLNGALTSYGTLRSLKNIRGFEQLFLKSGTTDVVKDKDTLTQSKWLAGAIKVKNKKYSLVIMVENERGLGLRIKHSELIKPIFNEIVKSLNK